jgi:pyruvate/2-oxoglutarate dehydrogenase complex dihydrolipoamide acyltransferase (E2) component
MPDDTDTTAAEEPPTTRWFADALPAEALVMRVPTAPGDVVVAGQPLVELEAHICRAPRGGRIVAVHVRSGNVVGPGWPLVDVEAHPDDVQPPLPPAPGGALDLAWTHAGLVVRPADAGQRVLVDVGLIAIAVALTLLTAWSLFGFARILVVGTGPAGGLWCLVAAPGLAWIVARSAGERLWQQALGVRRLEATADTLSLRTWMFERRVALGEIRDVLPTAGGVRLELADQVMQVPLAWTTAAQRAWVARGLHLAARQARSLPDLSSPPPELTDLRGRD